METSIANRALPATAVALLLGGITATLLVAERAADALWQWYKFAGYSGPGYITLGVASGVALILGCSAMAATSLLIARSARVRYMPQTKKVAVLASVAALGPLFVYVVLLVGPLAVWRA